MSGANSEPRRALSSSARALSPPARALSPQRALSLLTVFLAAAALAAQEAPADEFDPFAEGAFEAATAAAADASADGAAPSGDRAATTEILAGGDVTVSATSYVPDSFDGYAGLSSISGKVFAKVSVPDYGSLFASMTAIQDVFAGVSGSVPLGLTGLATGADLAEPDYALSELHWSFDIGKKVFFRLGKQLLSWGPSQVWAPVDFMNAERENFFAGLDLREGKAGFRVHVPFGKANLFLFSDFSGLDGGAGDPAKEVNYAARFDATVSGFELGLTSFWGPEAQAKGGLDFNGYLLGMTVYGELAAGPEYSGYGGFILASLGASRTLGDLKKWTLAAEGLYNSAGTELALAPPDAAPLYIGRWYAYASIKGQDFPAKNIDSTLYGLANLTDGSWQASLSVGVGIPRLVPFTVILSYYGGGAGTELTALAGQSFQLTVRTRISF